MAAMWLDLNDRFILAMEQLVRVYHDRGEFISDDDILDVSECWTTSKRDAEGYWPENEIDADIHQLRDMMFAACTQSEDD
jgi:hypothetical protein